MLSIHFGVFSFGKMWTNIEKQLFFPVVTAGLAKTAWMTTVKLGSIGLGKMTAETQKYINVTLFIGPN